MMKKNRIYIVWIIVLSLLIGFSIYNFTHFVSNKEKIIYSGKVLGFKDELDYNDESEYVSTKKMEIETKNNGGISITINATDEYKSGDKINYYEEKGEYKITSEKSNENDNCIWIILPIVEFLGIIICIVKIKKN